MLKVVLAITLACGVHSQTNAPLNEFSFNLLQNVFAYQDNFGPQNLAVSPVSVWNIFALISEGAAGSTFNELSQLLRLPKDLKSTQLLHKSTNDIFHRDTKDVILKKKTAIFVEQLLQMHRDFYDSALSYGTDVYTVDTNNISKLVDDINDYICYATAGKIKNAVKPDVLENLKLLIVDAMYFKANWTVPFDPTDTRKEAFYDQQGRKIGTVNMMYQKAKNKLDASQELEAEILELTYGKHKEFSMLIFLPFRGTPLKKMLNNLATQDPTKWIEKLNRLQDYPEVECSVPRFKISSQLDLIQPLKYMGLVNVFDQAKAEFPGITDVPLFVSKVIQKIDLDVTEEGTEAAAATVLGFENRIAGPSIRVNSPFAYAIMEKKSNVVLFSGVYSNPDAQ